MTDTSLAASGRQPSTASHGVSFPEAFRVWLRVAALSFGGPAGQIAVMHRIIVDEKKWVGENRFTSAPIFVINGLKREELIAMNSMILHEIFFASLGEGGEPAGALRDALIRDFGSVSAWAAEFSAMGKAQRGGAGWVLLTWSTRDRKLLNQWAMDHSTTLAGGQPILALDMYEHSYHIDYGAQAAAYVDAFMAAINWPSVTAAYASQASH